MVPGTYVHNAFFFGFVIFAGRADRVLGLLLSFLLCPERSMRRARPNVTKLLPVIFVTPRPPSNFHSISLTFSTGREGATTKKRRAMMCVNGKISTTPFSISFGEKSSRKIVPAGCVESCVLSPRPQIE